MSLKLPHLETSVLNVVVLVVELYHKDAFKVQVVQVYAKSRKEKLHFVLRKIQIHSPRVILEDEPHNRLS